MFALLLPWRNKVHIIFFNFLPQFGTLCLQLQKCPLPSPFLGHIWKQNYSLLHTTRSNIFFCRRCLRFQLLTYGAAYKCFWHFDTWHFRKSRYIEPPESPVSTPLWGGCWFKCIYLAHESEDRIPLWCCYADVYRAIGCRDADSRCSRAASHCIVVRIGHGSSG